MGSTEARAAAWSGDDALESPLPDESFELDAEELRRRRLRRAASFFVHRHANVPAVVIGGGVSRSEQVSRCPLPGQAVYISANRHGCEIAHCDYIVCLDLVEKELRAFETPIVSTREFGEVRIFRERVNQSGMLGAYWAWVLGCTPILLCGMDCWRGGVYESDPHAETSSGTRVPFKSHVDAWRRARDVMAGADIRALGGPLVDEGVFPAHDPARPGAPITDARTLLREVGGVVVEWLVDAPLRPYTYRRGDVAEISENETKRLRGQFRTIGEIKKNDALRFQTRPARRRA